MNDRQWDQFFALLEMIVDMPVPTADEKIQAVKDAANERGDRAENNLDEFTSWNFDQ